MDYVTWALLGLVAGVVAKIVMPGKDPGGLIVTILIGIAGAIVGGKIAGHFGFGAVTGLDAKSIGIAAAGAFLLLVVWRLLFGKKGD